jgi:electron transfer flavoprotein alpha subunit
MSEILVLAEHRGGQLRDITFEMLGKAGELAEASGGGVSALVLGSGVGVIADTLKNHADDVLVRDCDGLASFNSAVYQPVVADVVRSREPALVMIGHTAFGVDLAPSLAVDLGLPLATDCVDVSYDGTELRATRQIYEGKVNAIVAFPGASRALVTIRPAAFSPGEASRGGKVTVLDVAVPDEPAFRKFIEYLEAAVGDVDITKSDVVVSVGRGIREPENIPMVEKLAEILGGVVGCSRPVVDAGWLPKERQVGSSGKTVKPKLYLATGISGSFQHVMGMKASGLIVAINKDPKAPIFRIADYGVVDDLFKVVPALTQKINELRQSGG